MFMIGLDCSSKHDLILESLQRWLGCVYKVAASLQEGKELKGSEKVRDLLEAIGAKLIIVMCKADFVQVRNTATARIELEKYSRYASICYNLIFKV